MKTSKPNFAVYRTRLSFIVKIIFYYAILELLLPITVSAQVNHCDPYLNTPKDYPYGYRLRSDRCEGIYIKDVSSTTLFVASLTESFEDYDLTSNNALHVEWMAIGGEAVQLRTHALKRKLYYRMDTIMSPAITSYTWPLDILSALKIKKGDVGVVGWTQYSVGGTKKNIYIPLLISQKRKSIRSGNYQLILLPGRELSEVFVSLATVGEDGNPESFLRDGEALGYGYYPAERGIRIPIVNLTAPGIYYLVLIHKQRFLTSSKIRPVLGSTSELLSALAQLD